MIAHRDAKGVQDMKQYVYIALTANGFIIGAFRDRESALDACAKYENEYPDSSTRVSDEPLL